MARRKENGAGTFRKIGDKWNYQFSYIDNTVRKLKNFTAETKEDCLIKAEEFLIEHSSGIDDEKNFTTISDLVLKKYSDDYAKNHTSEQGYARNINLVKQFEQYPISRIPIAEITYGQIEIFLQSIASYSDSVIKKLYGLVNLAFRIAKEQGLVSINPLDSKKLRRPNSDKSTKRVDGLTAEEQKHFLEALNDFKPKDHNSDYRLQLLIELYSGMRMGEINALKPEDIDLEKGIVHVKRTVSRGLEYRVFIKEGTKTYTGIRDIPVSSILRPVLEKVLREYEENPNPMGLLFYDEYKNDVIDTNQVNCYFGRVLEKAGVAHRGQHALRHTFATRCIEADVPPLVLKTWLGHRDIHITLDTYADVFENMHNSAIEKVEKYADMIDRSQRHEEE